MPRRANCSNWTQAAPLCANASRRQMLSALLNWIGHFSERGLTLCALAQQSLLARRYNTSLRRAAQNAAHEVLGCEKFDLSRMSLLLSFVNGRYKPTTG